MAARKGGRKITTLEGLATFVAEELGEVHKKLDFLIEDSVVRLEKKV